MRKVFLIPIRSGSKGLPNKNMLFFDDKPLVMHTIDKIRALSIEDTDIYVSTDSKSYKTDLELWGVNVILRNEELALDTTPSSAVVIDFLENTIRDEDVIFTLCQATSPLSTSLELKGALNIYESNDCENVISVTKSDKSLALFSPIENGYVSQLEGVDKNYRRQDAKDLYVPNGAFFITSKKSYLKNTSFFTKKTMPYIMNAETAIDIDNLHDFKNVLGQNYFNYVKNKDKAYIFRNSRKHKSILLIGDSRLRFYKNESVTNLSVSGISAVKVAEKIKDNYYVESLVIALGVNDLRYGYSSVEIIKAIEEISKKVNAKNLIVLEVVECLYRHEVSNVDIKNLNDNLRQHFYTACIEDISNSEGLLMKYTYDGLHFTKDCEKIVEMKINEIMGVSNENIYNSRNRL